MHSPHPRHGSETAMHFEIKRMLPVQKDNVSKPHPQPVSPKATEPCHRTSGQHGNRTAPSSSRPGQTSQHRRISARREPHLRETQAVSLQRTETAGPKNIAVRWALPQRGLPMAAQVPQALGPSGSHFLNDVQQAIKVVGVAAFSQIYQQLGGQLSDLVVFILRDVGEL